uniref:Uncharacterized protein n=1 Tax=Rhizophora mucronata TaxID=61149 RepID=A0A2P2QJE1_RHIMU
MKKLLIHIFIPVQRLLVRPKTSTYKVTLGLLFINQLMSAKSQLYHW